MLSNYLNKKSILISILCLSLLNCFAQQNHTIPGSFSIIGEESESKRTFYIQSIESANMEQFRLKNQDVALHFENGFECVLFSAKSLIIKGVAVNPNLYKETFDLTYTLPVFLVQPSGQIVGQVSKFEKVPGNNSNK